MGIDGGIKTVYSIFMKNYFDVDEFLKDMSDKKILTKDIAEYLDYSERYIQRWRKSRKDTKKREIYSWNENDLKIFADWYNNRKPRFITIRDIVNELTNNKYDDNKQLAQNIQRWCKYKIEKDDIGRYIISEETKIEILARFSPEGIKKMNKSRIQSYNYINAKKRDSKYNYFCKHCNQQFKWVDFYGSSNTCPCCGEQFAYRNFGDENNDFIQELK
jgi:hypothetical protein